MVREAKLAMRRHGCSPEESGWFVLNAADAEWVGGPFGSFTAFEGAEARFGQFGFNVAVLEPGQPNCRYHAENEQEDFLVLDGECLLIVEGEERPLRRSRSSPAGCPAPDAPRPRAAQPRSSCNRQPSAPGSASASSGPHEPFA